MALDNFIGRSLEWKVSMLSAVQEARLTGQTTVIQTAHGVRTEFNIAQTNITQLLRELEQSIVSDPDFNPDDPNQAACAANVRVEVTRQSHF